MGPKDKILVYNASASYSNTSPIPAKQSTEPPIQTEAKTSSIPFSFTFNQKVYFALLKRLPVKMLKVDATIESRHTAR
jgi:hypothetical protein